MFWDTPGRLTEISKLRLEDMDLDAGAVLVMGKGRRERWMPIGAAARSVLLGYLHEREKLSPATDALWVSEHREELLSGGVFQILKRLGKRAGIANLHTHRFRHSYAVNALRAGMPERVLQIVGGLEEDTRHLLPYIGRRGRHRVPPAGEPGRPVGAGTIVGKGSAEGPAAREAVTGRRTLV